MTFASYRHYSVDERKLLAVGAVSGVAAGLVVQLVSGEALGGAAPGLEAVVALAVFYMVASIPRRALEAEAFDESKEAAGLSIMSSATFNATRSRSRTMLMLRPRNPQLRRVLCEVKRAILLGTPPEQAVRGGSSAVASYSVSNVLRKAATMSADSMEEGGEERRAMLNAMLLSEESKLPLFTTVCLFTPIMLTLYAVFSHAGDPRSLAGLVGLQVVVVDIAYFFSSPERRNLG